MQLFYYLKHDVRYLAGAIGTFAGNAANVNIRKIVVCAAFACGYSDFGRCRVVVYFYPEA